MQYTLSVLAGLLSAAQATPTPVQARAPTGPPTTSTQFSIAVEILGNTTESNTTFKGISRDGGGGGTINGHNVILYSDTEVNGAGPVCKHHCLCG